MDTKDKKMIIDGLQTERDDTRLCFRYKKPAKMGLMLVLPGVVMFGLGWFIPVESEYFWVFVPTGFVLILYGLMTMINKWIIQVTNDELQVRYGPIPFYHRRRRLPSREIGQLYVEFNPRYSRWGNDLGYCVLEAVLHDNHRVPLVFDVPYNVLHYFELQIESWLMLANHRVEGEIFSNAPEDAAEKKPQDM